MYVLNHDKFELSYVWDVRKHCCSIANFTPDPKCIFIEVYSYDK